MIRAINAFKAIMSDTQNIGALYSYLESFVRPPYDYSDLLRWQWAQSVSALDKLIHDLVRMGMIETFSGRRVSTAKFQNHQINMNIFAQISNNTVEAVRLFEQDIIKKHGYLSFQDPEKISDALSNIWAENHRWNAISNEMGKGEQYVKTKLKNIAIRRNQIVHEGDYSLDLGERQSISPNDVIEVMEFILALGSAIYELVKLDSSNQS